MQLYEGEIGKTYIVEDMHMPLETERAHGSPGHDEKNLRHCDE